MREALGLNGRREAGPPRQPVEPARPVRPAPDRAAGTGHRHRFVQDGEVPVVLISHANGAQTGAAPPRASEIRQAHPRGNGLGGDFGAERAARERAERQVQQAQIVIRDLETKLAHAEMARSEAVASARADKAALASVREECRGMLNDLRHELIAERASRERAEVTLRDVLAARSRSESEARANAAPAPTPSMLARKRMAAAAPAKPARVAARKEPKPVKWWR